MAQRRMFSPKIVSSDAFLDMPTSSRELYFQLGMYADDDGFINPKKIIRMVGASEDDLKVLIGKRFVIPFENGVVVIKHWKINNLIRKDFYQETVYVEEKKLLITKENGGYTESVNNPLTIRSRRLGKVRLGKESIESKDTHTQTFFEDKEQQVDIHNWLVNKGYAADMVQLEISKFINYWNECDQHNKPRWKKEKVFQIKNRFITWFSRIK